MSGARPQALAVVALLALALAALSVGIPATFAPRGFYTGYPFVRHWVDRLPPYSEHLTRDVGELETAFGLLFLWAAWSVWRGWPGARALIVPVCLAWALSQTLHAVYHLMHLSPFSAADAAGEMVGFVVIVGLALIAAWLSARSPAQRGP